MQVIRKSDRKTFALKVLKKHQLVEAKEVRSTIVNKDAHIIAMRKPFANDRFGVSRSSYIVKLHCTFQSPTKLYFVLDWINRRTVFSLETRRAVSARVRLYGAELVLALEHLHSSIMYRCANFCITYPGSLMLWWLLFQRYQARKRASRLGRYATVNVAAVSLAHSRVHRSREADRFWFGEAADSHGRTHTDILRHTGVYGYRNFCHLLL